MRRSLIMLATIFAVLLIISGYINFEYLYSKSRSYIIGSTVDNAPGVAPSDTYPVILLHGFNPTYSKRLSEFSLKHMQLKLSEDLGYVNKGIYFDDITCAELRYSDNPIIIRASYFMNYELLEVEEYSKIVEGIIDKILFCTGAEKVDLVSHSMGGIIARYYIQYINQTTIRRFIMIATPNHGGLYNIGSFTDLLIDDGQSRIAMDFIELSENHDFMRTLNNGSETVGDIQYFTIAGNIDDQGDGLILASSVALDGAVSNMTVPCHHFFMKYPSICPYVYRIVNEVLRAP